MKKCPLRTKMDDRNCVRNECEWWDDTFEGCSVRLLAVAESEVGRRLVARMEDIGKREKLENMREKLERND